MSCLRGWIYPCCRFKDTKILQIKASHQIFLSNIIKLLYLADFSTKAMTFYAPFIPESIISPDYHLPVIGLYHFPAR